MESKSLKISFRSGVLLLPLFFVLTSFLAFGPQDRFNSPDETANNFFIRVFAQTGRLESREELNLVAPIVHPRSTSLKGDAIVPGSFIGLIILYGTLADLFGLWVVPFLTPFFATLALGAFYYCVRRVWGEKAAVVSALVWFIHPAVLYYTARGLLPNMLFVSLVIMAAGLVVRPWRKDNPGRKALVSYLLAGLCLGWALGVRFSEVLWLAPLVIILAVIYRTNLTIKSAVAFASGLAIALVLIFFYQQITFGSFLSTGYSHVTNPVPAAEAQSQGQDRTEPTNSTVSEPESPKASLKDSLKKYKPYVLPFGFDAHFIRNNSRNYLVEIFWWLTLPALWFVIWALVNRKSFTRAQKLSFILGGGISFWLIVYYGSSNFVDSTLLTATIGTSYVRYWLPIYIWLIPFIALAWLRWRRPLSIIYGLIAAVLGIGLTFFFTPESLVPVKRSLALYQQLNKETLTATEENAVIITWRTDKIFFPERKVINTLPGDYSYLSGVSKLIPQAPVYFFALMPQPEIDRLNAGPFAENGLTLKFYRAMGEYSLYKVESL